MKITQLTLRNVGCYPEVALTFDQPIIFVLGDNGHGKTTLVRALEVLVTGAVGAFRGHRLGLGALIGPAGPTAEIEGVIESGGKPVTILRRLTAKGLETRLNGKDAGRAVEDFFSPAGMRHPERAWRAVTSVYGVLDQDEAAQKTVFADLIDPRIPPDLVASLPLEHLANPGQASPACATFDDATARYQEAYSQRTAAKRELAALGRPERPAMERQDVAAVTQKLAVLRNQLTALVVTSATLVGRRQELARRRETVEEAADRAQVRLTELGAPDTLADQLARIETSLATVAAQRTAHAAETANLDTLRKNLEVLRSQAQQLGSLGKACVIAADLECPLKPAQRKQQDQAWRTRIDALKEEIAHREAALVPVPSAKALEAERAALVASLKQIEAETARRREALTELTTLDAEVAALGPVVAEPPAAADLRQRIAKGEANLRAAEQINAAWEAFQREHARYDAASVRVQALETLCRALGPKGVTEGLLLQRFGTALAMINGALTPFGLVLRIALETGWGLQFNGRHVLLLSTSERFRAGVAFLLAIAQVSGARFGLLDGVDILDRTQKSLLFGLLTQAVTTDSGVDQLVVTATLQNPAALERAWGAPFRAFYLEAPGKVRAL